MAIYSPASNSGYRYALYLILLAAICIAQVSIALPVQSPARPFGLDIVGPVQSSGSDPASVLFNSTELSYMQSWLGENFTESTAIDDSSFPLDSSNLILKYYSPNARVYFIGEGAGYHNSLGFILTGPRLNVSIPKLIFPDASSYGRGSPDSRYPLTIGDFVDLGPVTEGTSIGFFLIANGARGGRQVWSTKTEYNADGINHVVSLVRPESPYLLIGFEDLYGGGDNDFNDLVFALEIGANNAKALRGVSVLAVPDAGSTLVALTLSLFLLGVVNPVRNGRS